MITIQKHHNLWAVKIGSNYNNNLTADETLFVLALFLTTGKVHHFLSSNSSWVGDNVSEAKPSR